MSRLHEPSDLSPYLLKEVQKGRLSQVTNIRATDFRSHAQWLVWLVFARLYATAPRQGVKHFLGLIFSL